MDESNSPLSGSQGKFLRHMPVDGSTVSNKVLQEAVGWSSSAHYFAVRNELVDAGFVALGPGRGGTVRRLVPGPGMLGGASASVGDGSGIFALAYPDETTLYTPMRDVIAGDWAEDHRRALLAVEITAFGGSRVTGGVWSRPDIAAVEVTTYAHVPGKYLQVLTFEVKPATAVNVQAVYEALSHRRATTHAYVLLHVPDERAQQIEPNVVDVSDVARVHGVGVITAADPKDYHTWNERVPAERFEPDPARLDAFIDKQLSREAQRQIALRLR